MDHSQSRLSVQELSDKVTYDHILDSISRKTNDHGMSFAGEFILAINMTKDEAVSYLTETLKKVNFNVVALTSGLIIGKGPDAYTEIRASQRSKYSTLYFRFWSPTSELKRDFQAWAKKVFEKKLIEGTICGLRWAYANKHGLGTTYVEELLSDVIYEEAYPCIVKEFGSLKKFVTEYIESDESVLVLQGPPGTGKSRLIRYLMANLVELRKVDKDMLDEYGDLSPSSKSLVLYTSDADALKGDELFAHFITSDETMFVIEDADNMLRSRQNGNDHLHRFLTVSDGIIRNVGRKVVFTTNLPNMGDIDEALLRPGRCFAAVCLSGMKQEDAMQLGAKLSNNDKRMEKIIAEYFTKNKMMTLAEIYKANKSLDKQNVRKVIIS